MVSRRNLMKLAVLSMAGCLQKSGVEVMFAASLQREMEDGVVPAFEQKTGIPVEAEARGSVTIINMVRDGYRKPDVIISADADLLNELKPDYVKNYAIFASNSIVIAHTTADISENTWIDDILSEKYTFGISDPASDPLGYRSLMVIKLAEIVYGRKIYEDIRKKLLVFGLETDLAANIKAGTVDAGFLYRNMARSHQLSFITLPEQIDLSSPDYQEFYRKAIIKTENRVHRGGAILYGIASTVWSGDNGKRFLDFILGEGRKLLEKYGLKTMVRWY